MHSLVPSTPLQQPNQPVTLVQFKCERINPADIDFHPKKTVHIKGFASGLREMHFPEELLSHILDFDHIVFDGDDLKLDSFTKYIAFLAPRLDHSRQKLVAFRLTETHEEFQESWQRSVKIDSSAYPAGITVHEPQEQEKQALPAVKVPIHYVLVPDDLNSDNVIPNDRFDFTQLGLLALQTTGAQHVVSLGGGDCVIQEFQQSSPGIEWTFFDISRERQGRIEASALRPLVDLGAAGMEAEKRVEVQQRGHPQLWSIRRHDKNHPTSAGEQTILPCFDGKDDGNDVAALTSDAGNRGDEKKWKS